MALYRNCQNCGLPDLPLELTIDDAGFCSFCNYYLRELEPKLRSQRKLGIEWVVNRTRSSYPNIDEIVVPISGGVDSCFTAHIAKQYFETVTLLHVDTGWNSARAIKNINCIATQTGFRYHCVVLPWEAQRAMYVAAIKNGVNNLDLIQDNSIFAALDKYHRERSIPIWLGLNSKTEFVHFQNWHESYRDSFLLNYLRLVSGAHRYAVLSLTSKITKVSFRPLDFIDYNKSDALEILEKNYGYERYSEKHSESEFTKFFQNVYAPQKGLVKRLQHEANLAIINERPRLTPKDYTELEYLSKSDIFYVLKKLRYKFEGNWPKKSLLARIISLNLIFRLYRWAKKK